MICNYYHYNSGGQMKTKSWMFIAFSLILAIAIGCCFIPWESHKSYADDTPSNYLLLDGNVLFQASSDSGVSHSPNGSSFLFEADDELDVTFNKTLTALGDDEVIVNKDGEIVSKPNTSASIVTTYVNFFKNNKEVTIDGYVPSGNDERVFTFDIDNSFGFKETNSSGEPVIVADMTGNWKIKYSYTYTLNGQVNASGEYEYSFTLLDYDDYNKPGQALSFTNVDTVNEKTKVEDPDTYHYNQQYTYNWNRTDVDGNTLYPVLTYNPNKYSLSFVRTIAKRTITYTQTAVFDKGVQFSIKDSSLPTATIETFTCDRNISESNIFTITDPFKELGMFSFTIQFMSGGKVITLADSNIEKQNNEAKSLLVFGYQAQYTDCNDGSLKLFSSLTERASIQSSIEVAATKVSDNIYSFQYEGHTYYTKANNKIYSDEIATTEVLTLPLTVAELDTTKSKVTITYATNSTVVSTNQAPVRFSYLGNLDSSTVLLNGATLTDNYSQGSSFSKAGEYEVTLDYHYTDNATAYVYYGSQTFKFKIDNSLPDYKLAYQTGSSYAELNQKYINKDIILGVKNVESSFMAPVTASVLYTSSYLSDATYTKVGDITSSTNTVLIDSNNYSKYTGYDITASGQYKVLISYGSNKAVTTHYFVIDKNPISGISANTAIKYPNTALYYNTKTPITTNSQDIALTSEPILYVWNTKESQAKIKVHYTYLPFKSIGTKGDKVAFDSKLGITNGYTINDASTDTLYCKDGTTQYSKTLKDTSIITKAADIISSDGIFIFTFEDEAGNRTQKILMYDSTSPYINQQSLVGGMMESSFDIIANPDNLVSSATKLTWGDYKTITVDTTSISDTFGSLDGKTYISKVGENYYINVPINDVQYNLQTETSVLVNQPIVSSLQASIIYKNATEQTSYSSSINTGINNEMVGEGTYIYKITSANGKSYTRVVEMNLDMSKGRLYATDSNDKTISIANGGATNFDRIHFSLDKSTYDIASVTYEYYAFVNNGTAYPFDTNPIKYILFAKDEEIRSTLTTSGYRVDSFGEIIAQEGSDELISGIINYNDQKECSYPGKYVITRTYTDDNATFGDDKKVRTYTYIVDQNEIIVPQDNIGDYISISLADSSSEEITFKNWTRITSDGLFVTNKLPIKVKIPYSKYYNGNIISDYYFSMLDIQLTYQSFDNVPPVTYRYSAEDVIEVGGGEIYFNIPADLINQEGTYTFSISDRTGYLTSEAINVNPTVKTFSFKVKHNYPTINVVENDEPIELINSTYYTNIEDITSNKLSVKFTDPSDPYSAKIRTVAIKRTYGDTNTTSTFYIPASATIFSNLQDNGGTKTYTVSQDGYSMVITLIGELMFEGVVYYQYSYNIDLDISQEYTYEVTPNYLSEDQIVNGENIYQFEDLDYSQRTYNIRIDRTKPDTNVDNLINNDDYLRTTAYTGFVSAESFKDPATYSSDIVSLENYYLVPKNTAFSLSMEENEYDYFFIRSFNKVSDSYTTSFDEIVDVPNKFKKVAYSTSSLREIISQEFNRTNLNGYYEIIERDYAGNYRMYLVYLNDFATTSPQSPFAIQLSEDEPINALANNFTYVYSMEATSIDSFSPWYTISVNKRLSNNQQSTTSVTFKKNSGLKEIDNNIKTLNAIFASNENAGYTITYTSAYSSVTVVANLILDYEKFTAPSQKDVTTITNGDSTTFQVKITKTKGFLYLKKLSYIFNGEKVEYNEAELQDLEYITLTSRGYYEFSFIDNYSYKKYSTDEARTYKSTTLIGIDNIAETDMYDFGDAHTYTKDGIIYTDKAFTIKNISNFTVGIKRNTTSYPYTLVNNSISCEAPVIDLSGQTSDNIVGDIYRYDIIFNYTNSDGSQVTIDSMTKTIVVCNQSPKIHFFNSQNGNEIGFGNTGNNITSKSLRISWEEILTEYDDLNNFAARYYVIDENGNKLSSTPTPYTMNTALINSGSTINYLFEVYNTALNYSREVRFSIAEKNTTMYTIEAGSRRIQVSPITLDATTTDMSTVMSSIRTASSSAERDYINKVDQKEIPQYFTNNRDVEVILNTDNNLQVAYYIFVNGQFDSKSSTFNKALYNSNPTWTSAYVTVFALIYGDTNVQYSDMITFTVVPTNSTDLLKKDGSIIFGYKNGTENIDFGGTSKVLTCEDISNNQFVLYWKKDATTAADEWYKRGNINYLSYTYSGKTNNQVVGQIDNRGNYSQLISGSGLHTIRVYDWAGNEYKFVGSTSDYLITVLDTIIYTVNGSAPIDNVIYNNSVTIAIDSNYESYYLKDRIGITVLRNGSYYTDYVTDGYSFTFNSTGRYKVTITGRYSFSSSRDLNPAEYNFTILEPTSSRIAWEFSRQSKAYITKVLKDGIDITNTIKNNEGIEKIDALYLSSSSYGRGSYVIYVNSLINDLVGISQYQFRLRINDEVPVIQSSPEYGGTTKGKITLSYNAGQIYDQIGRSYIRILTYDNDSGTFNTYMQYAIDSSLAQDNSISTIEITQSNSYYVQLVTDNGNVVLSFRVNRSEPLNTIAIILIVVSAVTVIVLTIVFIKLRTKMKIK